MRERMISTSAHSLESLLKAFYAEASFDLPVPKRREFAFQHWDAPGPNDRHHHFSDFEELRRVMEHRAPKALFASSAHYLDPGHPRIDNKGMVSSELVFDFDVGDLPSHEQSDDFWQNMDAVATHVRRLLEERLPELGFDTSNAFISFSGGKGFHVRFFEEALGGMSKTAREEIQNHVSGNALNPMHVFGVGRKTPRSKLRPRYIPGLTGGWPGVVSACTREYLLTIASVDDATAIAFMKANAPIQRSGENKGKKVTVANATLTEIVRAIRASPRFVEEGGIFESILKTKKNSDFVVESILWLAKIRYGCAIDLSVTSDPRKLLRVPGSIHGKTGLPCIVLSRDELNCESIKRKIAERVGEDEVNICLKHPVRTPFGTFESEVTLPRYQALAALCAEKQG